MSATIQIPFTDLKSTAVGALAYGDTGGAVAELAPNTTTTRKFLAQTGTGTIGAAPVWSTISAGDVPALGANPSASIGLTAVNGSASTYLRSDGAPALSQAIVPTWTGVHTWSQTLAANTSGDGVVLANTGAATSGNQRYSPRLRLTGAGWKTGFGATSQVVDWILETQPFNGSGVAGNSLVLSHQENGGGYVAAATFLSGGGLTLAGGLTATSFVVSGISLFLSGAGNALTFSVPGSNTITISGDNTFPTLQVSNAGGFKSSDGSTGFTGTVTTASLVGKTITIKDGIVTAFA